MADPVVVESWHLPRALSDEALRLLTRLSMEEIERRLRMDGPAGHERPTDEQLDDLFVEIDGSGETQSWRAFARAVLACWGAAAPAADGEVAELVAWLRVTGELLNRRSDIQCRVDLRLFHRAALLLERQALRPIPVSERLPEPEDCLPWPDEPDVDPWCWLGSNVDDGWEWEQRSAKSLSYWSDFTHWLPAHALPLPEVE